jgi:hypothetical protein
MTTYIYERLPDIPVIIPVMSVPMIPSERIALAYSDPNMSAAEFEALVNSIYGFGDLEEDF